MTRDTLSLSRSHAHPEWPVFSAMDPVTFEPALIRLLDRHRVAIADLLAQPEPPDWKFIEALETLDYELAGFWGPIQHLHAVADSEPLREAYKACLPRLSAYHTERGQNRSLYLSYQSLRERAPDETLDASQRKLLDDALRDFRLAGVDLSPDHQARFREIDQILSRLTNRFEEQLLDATQGWTLTLTDPVQLAGLPETARALARQNAGQRQIEGWVLTLEYPSYGPAMAYAEDRALRRTLYEAYVTRASETGPQAGRWDNGPLMEEILALRHEMAGLLGFSDFAALSFATKMAPSPEMVRTFLEDLARRVRHQAERELAELRAFARETLGLPDLEAWDMPFAAERLRKYRHDIDQEALRPYFPETRVVPGLFAVAGRLFGIRVEDQGIVDRWHPSVQCFALLDRQDQPIGYFYLDLYARPHKRGGAWLDDSLPRFKSAAGLKRPLAYIVCNFTPPVDGQPALFTHAEVETLFHEFGHALHHLLTQIDHPPVAGIHGVPWDAVELPSQFLENWCWEPEALALVSGHFQTGEAIPVDLYERLRGAKNFQSALQTLRQVEFSLFDLRLHQEYDPALGGRVYEILKAIRAAVAVVQPPAFNRFAHGFSHIFAGGYAAGYYSYKWAEVLSADAFSLFEERGVFDPATGAAFRDNILARGGSEDALSLFVAFRGREPTLDALLRQNGIAETVE
ncbi:MAG: M3 family metallopeptidase [Pseudomonadota bacterium]